jgi:hypothetical protein
MKNQNHLISSLINIGVATTKKLNRIGIFTIDDFLCRNPYEVFAELLEKVDPTLCRCALASIIGAYIGRPWHKVMKQASKEFENKYPNHRWGKC